MTRARKRLLVIAGSLVGAVLLAGLALVLTVRSDWFYNKVRQRMIAEVERSTGGRAEIGRFAFDWKTLQATAGPFILHGTEGPGEVPLFRATRVLMGLKIISLPGRRMELSSLVVDRPRVHLMVRPDGSTNVPGPRVTSADEILQGAIALGIGHFELRNGLAEINNRKVPFDLRGDNLAATFDYNPRSRRFDGSVSSGAARIESPRVRTAVLSASAALSVAPGQVQVSSARFSTEHSTLEASGVVRDFSSPRGDFDLNASFSIAEIGRHVPLPVEPAGEGDLRGKLKFSFGDKTDFELAGRLTARGLGWRSPDLRVSGIGLSSDVQITPERTIFPHFTATALGGSFTGRAAVEHFREFRVDGEARNLSVAQVNRLELHQPLPWNGIASGAVHVDGLLEANSARTLTARAALAIAPSPGPNPIQGAINVSYDGRTRLLQFGKSHVETGKTRLEMAGILGRTMNVALRSGDLDDLAPALLLLEPGAPKSIPVQIAAGEATVVGDITGPLDNPHFAGRVALPQFTAAGQSFDRFHAAVDVTPARFEAENLELDQGAARVSGTASVALAHWLAAPASSFSASLRVRGVDIASAAKAFHRTLPVAGIAASTLELGGTLERPTGSIIVAIENPSAWGETFDALHASLRLSPDLLEIVSAELRLAKSRIAATGAYHRTGATWNDGSLTFHIGSTAIPVNRLNHVRDFNDRINGRIFIDATGSGRIVNGNFEPASINGNLAGKDLALNGAALGAAEITAAMKGTALSLGIKGALRNTQIQGAGEWQLAGDYPGRAEIRFTPLSWDTLRDLGVPMPVSGPLPFQGFVDGSVVVSGPIDKPSLLTAAVTLSHVEIGANPEQRLRAGARAQDLVVRNTEPMQFELTSRHLLIHSARLAATDTRLEASGRVTFGAKSPWDVTVRGGLNLAILQLLNADLLARGNAVLDARLQGALSNPQVDGRLELRKASLYLGALPSGIDNANGLVTFDRDRATIQTLTADMGGGRVGLGGFVGFGGGVLLYRVQASADQVRLRNEDGATVTFNAGLNLTGSSKQALISGSVTILRAGFAPRTDLGALLAESARPTPSPVSPNEYLRGVSFDIRIESGASLEFETSLTHDIEAEAELRLRGDAARPVLLGDISVTQGDIVLFGSKYEINRCDIRFLNPTRIEPTVDIDLQTKARGISVNISFAGTLNNLKMTYRSDPPLQTNDIIALLAVGRDPMASAGLASSQLARQSSIFSAGPNTIAQAMSAPASGRLQRFFGVSRLKIDPQLLGVENIPQARLTLEQQVSRDITITYVTNLSRTQEQIVRLEWDMNRKWSAVATREENGVFGVDFQYKTRFK